MGLKEYCGLLGGQGQADFGLGGPIEGAADEAAGVDELLQVDAGGQTHAVQHVDDLFGGHVARGSARVRAAAQTGHGRVHHRHAHLPSVKDVIDQEKGKSTRRTVSITSRPRRMLAKAWP